MTPLRKPAKASIRRLANSRSRRVPCFAADLRCHAAIVVLLQFWVALAVSAAQTPQPTSASQTPSVAPLAGAIISQWSGPIQVQLPGAVATHPVRGQILPEGTTLDTRDGQLILVLRSDESEILVQAHTRLILRAPQPGNWDTMMILIGRVRAYIRKRTGGAPPFQMGTPSAVIAVRGTRFDVEVDSRGITEVDVFQGLVEVGSTTLRGASVLVSPGMSTRVGPGTAPETPVPTREIRPDVAAPEEMAKVEFARQRALSVDRMGDTEVGERRDSEVSEVIDESRESETKKP